MRFIRKEHIVTTIYNKEITDTDTIKVVLHNLYDYKISFSLTIKKFLPHQQEHFNLNFESVRIKDINDDNNNIDVIAFKKGIKTRMKSLSINDIVEINATTKKHEILNTDNDVTRWELMDFSE